MRQRYCVWAVRHYLVLMKEILYAINSNAKLSLQRSFSYSSFEKYTLVKWDKENIFQGDIFPPSRIPLCHWGISSASSDCRGKNVKELGAS